MHIDPNAMYDYMAKKAIPMIWVIATIIDCNILLCNNNHDYCNKHKKLLQSDIATLLLATIFNQSHIVAIGKYCNKYNPIGRENQAAAEDWAGASGCPGRHRACGAGAPHGGAWGCEARGTREN
jgi:hypothetical protein